MTSERELTYEQMMQACQAIGDISLRMRKPGDWYVSHIGVSISNGIILSGRFGNGGSPVEAVHAHWQCLTQLKPGEYVLQDSVGRRAMKWNGFMWADVQEAKP